MLSEFFRDYRLDKWQCIYSLEARMRRVRVSGKTDWGRSTQTHLLYFILFNRSKPTSYCDVGQVDSQSRQILIFVGRHPCICRCSDVDPAQSLAFGFTFFNLEVVVLIGQRHGCSLGQLSLILLLSGHVNLELWRLQRRRFYEGQIVVPARNNEKCKEIDLKNFRCSF